MLLFRSLWKTAACCVLAGGVPGLASGQGNYVASGSEYAITGVQPGDQVFPQLSLKTAGGFLVWQDNTTDGDGLGISALQLDSSFSAALSPFRVNSIGAGDQEHPQVSLLNGGGAVFVWQGGRQGFQHIYARFLSTNNTWVGNDVLINSTTNRSQLNTVVATLTNGNVVVAWASLNQYSSNSMQDVYAQVLSPTGQKLGGEFLVNQTTAFNQRTPAVAALAGGGFVVAWVSEQQRVNVSSLPNQLLPATQWPSPSVDVYARLYNSNGSSVGGEFLVNTSSDVCDSPRVAASTDGGFMAAWGQKSLQSQVLGWDIYARPFSASGVGGTARAVNTTVYGDQYLPQISALGTDYLVVWTSLGQDGSREGVYGQFVSGDGTAVGGEFRVNSTTVGQQMHPAVAADGYGRFVAVWTSFIGGIGSFDVFAQRYVNVAQPLVAMNPPYVYVPFIVISNLYQPQLVVCWPVQDGLPIDHYEVYVDGALTATASVTSNLWIMTAPALGANNTHSFQVAYVSADGRKSPLSGSTSGTTWSGYNWGGIPFEWMAAMYNSWDTSTWPGANTRLAPGGPTVVQVFLTGGNPLNPATWLRTTLARKTSDGLTYYLLSWNTQPGVTYQVQTSSNISSAANWVNFQSARFAAGTNDSTVVPLNNLGYYRVLRLR